MTFKDAWNAIVGPRLRKSDDALWTEQDRADRRARIKRTFPQVSGPLDPAEREGRRVCETADAKLKRISKTAR